MDQTVNYEVILMVVTSDCLLDDGGCGEQREESRRHDCPLRFPATVRTDRMFTIRCWNMHSSASSLGPE
jgi:hypothetical protein